MYAHVGSHYNILSVMRLVCENAMTPTSAFLYMGVCVSVYGNVRICVVANLTCVELPILSDFHYFWVIDFLAEIC